MKHSRNVAKCAWFASTFTSAYSWVYLNTRSVTEFRACRMWILYMTAIAVGWYCTVVLLRTAYRRQRDISCKAWRSAAAAGSQHQHVINWRPLGSHFVQSHSPGVTTTRWHHYCSSYLRSILHQLQHVTARSTSSLACKFTSQIYYLLRMWNRLRRVKVCKVPMNILVPDVNMP